MLTYAYMCIFISCHFCPGPHKRILWKKNMRVHRRMCIHLHLRFHATNTRKNEGEGDRSTISHVKNKLSGNSELQTYVKAHVYPMFWKGVDNDNGLIELPNSMTADTS